MLCRTRTRQRAFEAAQQRFDKSVVGAIGNDLQYGGRRIGIAKHFDQPLHDAEILS